MKKKSKHWCLVGHRHSSCNLLFYWPPLSTAGTDLVSTSNMLEKNKLECTEVCLNPLLSGFCIKANKKAPLCSETHKKTSSCKHLHKPVCSTSINDFLESKANVPVLPSESVSPPHDHLFCLCSTRWLRSCVRRITASKCSCSIRKKIKTYLHCCPFNHKSYYTTPRINNMLLCNLICWNDNSDMNWALTLPALRRSVLHIPFPLPVSASSSPRQLVVSAPPSSAVLRPFSDAPLFGALLVAWLYAPVPWSETLAKLAKNTVYAACVHDRVCMQV